MIQFKYQQLYKQLVKLWSQSIIKERPPAQYYHTFLHRIRQNSDMAVFYDDRIADVILSLLKSFHFQIFNKHPSQKIQQSRRKSLFIIIDVLFKQGFIGKHERQMIQSQKEVYLQDKLKLFLTCCSETSYQEDNLQNLWFSIVEMDLITFWNYAQQTKIKDPILVDIYKYVFKCKSIINVKSIAFYVQTLQKKNKVQQPFIPERIIKPVVKYRRRESNKLNETLNQTFSVINPIIFNSQREQFKKRKKQLYQNMWFNTAKYQLYEQYISSVKQNSNQISLLLTQIAYSYSLFFNPRYKSILRSIFTFIHDVQTKIDHHKIVSYQYFGSIRSTLALSNQFDIDLTSIKAVSSRGKQREISREEVVNLLFEIKKKLVSTYPKWLHNSVVFKFQKIKVPFLKIQINKQELQKQFSLSGIQKLDITIGNKTAIKNSEIISYFARVPQICCFCLLIKLWAKNNEIINTKYPMKGLSSYGVILMCLYYLMDTKQIYFLPYNKEEFDIDNVKIAPDLDFCELLDLQDNFLGFLQFYKQTGVFQKQHKIVCLIQHSQQALEAFNEDIVFNMYDFLDNTNPGRLPFKDKDNVYTPFQRAIRIMKLRNQKQILQLINKPQ